MATKMMMMISVAYVAVLVLSANNASEAAIGINWGRQTAQRLIPSQVVDLLLQNGVRQARIYTGQQDILQAFAGSGINLIITVDPTKIATINDARAWVQKRAQYFVSSRVRYVFIGSFPFFIGLTNKTFLTYGLNALQCVQNALNEAGYGDQIKVTTPHPQMELKDNITKPSEAEFDEEIKQEMATFLSFLQQNNAPFHVELFPINYINDTIFDPSFAFPDNKSRTVIKDINGAVYTNGFEFTYDSFAWALKKLNFSDMKIIVSQVGWPTDGHPGANATAAEYFYKYLLPLVASNKGTPMRPGQPIDTFVHALTDENKSGFTEPFTRHWGIYRSNGEPKYKIDLSGQGRDIFPTTVKGIMRMPERWCMFNGNVTDVNKVDAQFNYACQQADCTSLAPGGSCGQLSYELNVSYAFNMHFQFQFQDEEACDFDGLGFISVNDPSTGECVFPVEVVKGQQNNFHPNTGKGFHDTPNCAAILVIVISILGRDIV